MEKETILVSACLLGVNCRYDGGGGRSAEVLKLMERYNLIPVCPEQMGGMKTPRKPAELRKQKGPEGEEVRKVFNEAGEDVTEFFVRGAREALELAKLYGCTRAVLKERSPSCGCGIVYDGTFSGKRVPGNGVTAELLTENNITVIGESKAALLMKEGEVQSGRSVNLKPWYNRKLCAKKQKENSTYRSKKRERKNKNHENRIDQRKSVGVTQKI